MWKQNLDGDKNNPNISGASITNFHLTLAWAKENFPVLRDLLGSREPEISIFFWNRQPSFLSTNQHDAERSLAQIVATNLHSVKYETLRFGHGLLVFLLYNFIMLILTQNCARVWISSTFKLDKEALKLSKVRLDNFSKTEMYHLNVTFSPPKSSITYRAGYPPVWVICWLFFAVCNN